MTSRRHHEAASPSGIGSDLAFASAGSPARGLPVGLQIIGPFFEDATPIHLASALGEVIGGFARPPGF